MNKKLLFSLFCLSLLFCSKINAQQWSISTNGLYWATATPNAAVEYAIKKNMTVSLNLNYNPFTFANNRKLKHLLLQPEYRYWLSESFKGHYLGVHGMWGQFNFSGLPLSDAMRDFRYEGDLIGGGVTYGYQWLIGNRLNLGAEIGFGYLSFDYNKFYCQTCGERIDHYKSDYFGPTKVGVNLIYLF